MKKKQLRKIFSSLRRIYTRNEINYYSNLIKMQLFKNFSNFNTVHIFIPIIEQNEVNTFFIIHELHKRDVDVIVPTLNLKKKIIISKRYTKNTILQKSHFNIFEPKPSDNDVFTDFNNIDIVIIPLLVFDCYGNRIGYGGGYYDKFLNEIDLKYIVIETDAPYLAPKPFRGKRNESAYLVNVAEKLSHIYKVSIEEVANVTTENSKTVFACFSISCGQIWTKFSQDES